MAVTASVTPLKTPSEALKAAPVPAVPTPSTKYSAAAMFEPPVVESLALAVRVTLTAPAVGLGLAATLLVTGPAVSDAADTVNTTEEVLPQLFKASLPWTYRLLLPVDRAVYW